MVEAGIYSYHNRGFTAMVNKMAYYDNHTAKSNQIDTCGSTEHINFIEASWCFIGPAEVCKW